MLEGFAHHEIETSGARIHARVGGQGPPLLLLHGFPQTHAMWHRIAPGLAERFTVVAPDLRGYGASSAPASALDHGPYSKRAMAVDQIELMARLGFARFHVVGHDRGGRCAYRLALDHPDRVERIAVLDIVPTRDALRRTDREVATQLWRWFFMAQPAPLPETLIAASPDEFFFGRHASAFAPEALEAYRAAVARPGVVHAMCEDYRAMQGLDREHDEQDFGVRTITAPTLALWGARSPTHRWFDVLDVWRAWAPSVRGRALDCGHFLPEEAPDETLAELLAFFGEADSAPPSVP